ncbi:MAG: sigma-70 family RNA polymerase sigma factor [Candidatus Hydrogenedentes bacterium]|nr:sigma-70 family RNA polymerase sigma factor [Candidatus Hydrogenedentota bacterium]
MSEDHVETLRRFYEANRNELYTYALALTRSREAAEDAIHTAFGKMLKTWSLPRELRPYVFRCVRNAAIDEHRARARESLHDSPFAIDESRNNGHDPELQHQLADLLLTLSDDERESIMLKIYSGMTFHEIAATRSVSINTAASWYRRGLEKLRVLMRGENE